MINLCEVQHLDPEVLARRDGYTSLRPGVDALYLYRDESGASCAVLKYAPGAEVPEHRHLGYEHVMVLSGAQQDARRRYGPGTLVINPPGTRHRVWSPEGCVALVIWERPVAFEPTRADSC